MEKPIDNQTDADSLPDEELPLDFMMGFTCINQYFQCDQCGGALYFAHHTDFFRNITLETAKCIDCSGKTKKILHRLQ